MEAAGSSAHGWLLSLGHLWIAACFQDRAPVDGRMAGRLGRRYPPGLAGKHFHHRVGQVSAARGRVGRRLRRHGGRCGRNAHGKDRWLHSRVDRLVPTPVNPRLSRCTCSRSCSCSQTSACSGGDRVGPRSSAVGLARRTLSSSRCGMCSGSLSDPSMSGALSEGGFVSSVVNKERECNNKKQGMDNPSPADMRISEARKGRSFMRKVLFSAVILRMAVCLSALGLMAQAPVGQIFGTILDPTGAPIAGASVVVTNLATGQTFGLKTDASGDYVVRELRPGEYSVTASSTGFKQVVRTPITLVAFQDSRVDVPLELGTTSEKITVSGDAPQVDTRSMVLGSEVDNKLLAEMPIGDRNIIETINYTPGVEHVTPGNNVNRNQQRVNIEGNRSYSTNEQLDGASM